MKTSVGTRKSCELVKSSLKRSFFASTMLAVLATSAIACTTEQPGLPTPGDTPPATNKPTIPGGGSTSKSTPRTTKPGSGNSPVSNLDPCTLLSSAEVATLAVKPGTSEGTQGCRWRAVSQGDYTIQVDVYDDLGIKDAQATGEIKPIANVGKHKAIQFPYGGTCTIALEITNTSRVDVAASAGSTVEKGCELAARVAPMVEPKLPGS